MYNILHIIDASGSIENTIDEHKTIESELLNYNEELLQRRQILLLNKTDLIQDSDQLDKLKKIFINKGLKVIHISALKGDGIENLKDILLETIEEKID
jgi:GTP-binding protein